MSQNDSKKPVAIKPKWLKSRLPSVDVYSKMKTMLSAGCLHTICESGKCPNIGECWAAGSATFMILGNSCTRNCRFCAVDHTKPLPADITEPVNLAATVETFNLKHCVITSVTRDDLPDEGASHWAACIKAVQSRNTHTTVEVLVPDFHACRDFIQIVASAKPDIFSHNLETVKRLTPVIRSGAQYDRSMNVLRIAHSLNLRVKSGIMIGLGETMNEILEVIKDIRETECDILTVGQYLQPRHDNIRVTKYYTPDEFAEIRKYALGLGFGYVESGPLVRSSYHSYEAL